MKKSFVLSLVILFLAITANAQVLDPDYGPRAWKKENTKQGEAIALAHVREADVIWSRRIWRVMDLRQKQNLTLYYPLQSGQDQQRTSLGKRSFVQVIFDMIENDSINNELNTYNTYELRTLIHSTEALSRFAMRDSSEELALDANYDCIGTKKVPVIQNFLKDAKPEIVKIHLMEDWFFDKQRSVMDVRILALGIELPLYDIGLATENCNGADVNVFEKFTKLDKGAQFVWFYFPDLRSELATTEIYNRHNDAHRTSFDDIFLKRMFSSYIVKEENVYDRSISDYTGGLDALLEAEKISEKIRDYEMDFWQY